MDNVSVNLKASGNNTTNGEPGGTEWEFVCEGKRFGDMMAAALEKMEEEYGEGVEVIFIAKATNEPTTI